MATMMMITAAAPPAAIATIGRVEEVAAGVACFMVVAGPAVTVGTTVGLA